MLSVDANSGINSFAKIVILAICVIAGLILSKKLVGGVISIASTLITGILISLVRAGVMIAAFSFLYYPNGDFYKSKIDDGVVTITASVDADNAVAPADKAMEVERISANWRNQMHPQGYAVTALLMSLVSGFFISILAAVFLSTNMMYKQ